MVNDGSATFCSNWIRIIKSAGNARGLLEVDYVSLFHGCKGHVMLLCGVNGKPAVHLPLKSGTESYYVCCV